MRIYKKIKKIGRLFFPRSWRKDMFNFVGCVLVSVSMLGLFYLAIFMGWLAL